MNTYKRKALRNLFPKSSFTELTEGGEIVSSDPNLLKVTDAEIDAEIVKIKEEETATQYQRDRATSYPSVGDQLDMMMKDMKNGTTTHQEACEAVKDKYPKP